MLALGSVFGYAGGTEMLGFKGGRNSKPNDEVCVLNERPGQEGWACVQQLTWPMA